jgi:cytochrome b561
MNWRNNTIRYGSLSVGLHWLMLLLLAAVYACMELRGNFPKGSDIREGLKTWHYMLGLSVFVLVSLRAAFHLLQTVPLIEPASPRWQELAAKAVHLGLYAFMIGMPLLGWLLLSAGGKPIPFFGLELPALIGEDKGFAELVKEIHEVGGTIGYFLIGIHAVAALYHHYVMRDNTLRRMLPR